MFEKEYKPSFECVLMPVQYTRFYNRPKKPTILQKLVNIFR